MLGLTFKPGTDDLREAPSIPNIRRLIDEGAEIVAYDPVGEENFKKIFPTEIKYVKIPEETLNNADAAFIFTEWNEIKSLGLNTFVELMKSPIIYDGRNCFQVQEANKYNIEYYSIGRNNIKNLNNLS